MTLDELKDYVKPLIFFGEIQFEISQEDDGHKIEILDHEEGRLIDVKGNVVEENYTSTTIKATLYTDNEGTIFFIEHGFGAFTRANKKQVELMASLIGMKIEIEKGE